jgi:glycosyltransferase 2 family protein
LASAPRGSPGARAPRGRGRLWLGLLGFVLSLAFLYWALRGVHLHEFVLHVRRANLGLFLLSVVLATLTFPARASRWHIILAATGSPVGWRPVWRATAIGFMANNVLPARAGELARAYAAARFADLPLARSIGSIAVERVFDGLIVVFLLALVILTFDFPGAVVVAGTSVSATAAWTGGLFILALGVLFFLVHAPREALRWLAALLRRVAPPRTADFVVRVTRSFIEGLSILRSPADFLRVVGWSLAIWLINASAFYAAFMAFHLGPLPFSSALLLQGIVAVGVALPSSPGFFGAFEYCSRIALGLYGVPPDSSVSFAVGTHLGWFFPITFIGLYYLARSGLSLHEISAAEA